MNGDYSNEGRSGTCEQARREIESQRAYFAEPRVNLQVVSQGQTELMVNLEAKLAASQAQVQMLRETLRNLEVCANTLRYCYDKRPENFASCLFELHEQTELAREALSTASDTSAIKEIEARK